jgi:hypothetical protein
MKNLKSFSQFLIKENMSDIAGKRYSVKVVEDIQNFIFAGHSIFTIESEVSKVWYTFKMEHPKKDTNTFFVSVLRGPDNTDSYSYVGMVKKNEKFFTLTKASKYKEDSTCVKAFGFFFRNLMKNYLHPEMNFYHMGYCGRCGRPLTVPDSVQRGIGPVCANLSDESRTNLDRKTKLVGMVKSWNQDDTKEQRKINQKRLKYGG